MNGSFEVDLKSDSPSLKSAPIIVNVYIFLNSDNLDVLKNNLPNICLFCVHTSV